MVRTIPTTTVHLYIKEKDSETTKEIERQFIGSEWTPTKMLKAIKSSATFPADATIENMTTDTQFTTFKLSDRAFVAAALKEMQYGTDIPDDEQETVASEE